MDASALQGGFATPPQQSARAFRGIMEAMARPGTIHQITGGEPPAPLSVAAGTVVLTLCDGDTPLYLAGDADTPMIRDWVAFHLGTPLVGPSDAVFAIGTWEALHPLDPYRIGTPDYPDRSVTLIVELPDLRAEGTRLTGPGIRTDAALTLPDAEAFAANAARFPLGFDTLFTCGDRVAALPRTTKVG